MSVPPCAPASRPSPPDAEPVPLASTSAASLPTGILSRLRLETRADHDAIDRTLDFTSAALTRAQYLHRLTQFFGFYQPLEAALRERSLSGSNSWILPRLGKTGLLAEDLAFFDVASNAVPVCGDLPPLATAADLLGCLYVMEGATLGGQVISRHLRAHLGITSDTGGRFFHGYGETSGKMWLSMREVLVTSVSSRDTADRVVKSATATFTTLRHWCEKK